MDKQLVLYPERCVGCRNCTMLCSKRHFDSFDPSLSAVTVFHFDEGYHNVPIMCLQCDDPACVKACSTQALSIQPDGRVYLERSRCIGCKFCVQVCPTGNVIYSPRNNKVLKCDMCDGAPLCAAWCPTKAIVYDNLPAGTNRRTAAAKGLCDTAESEVAK